MKTTRLLSIVVVIAGAILLVAGTSIIRTAFADANQVAPGQNFGQENKNPSSPNEPPPGQAHQIDPSSIVGNSGQCQKFGYGSHDFCHQK